MEKIPENHIDFAEHMKQATLKIDTRQLSYDMYDIKEVPASAPAIHPGKKRKNSIIKVKKSKIQKRSASDKRAVESSPSIKEVAEENC